MAFQKSALSQMGYTGADTGNALWFYADPDDDGATTIAGSGYMDKAGVMREGDIVFLVGGSDAGALLVVTSATGDPVVLDNGSVSAA